MGWSGFPAVSRMWAISSPTSSRRSKASRKWRVATLHQGPRTETQSSARRRSQRRLRRDSAFNSSTAMPTRVPLTQISSRAWEHAADRAALNTLRAIPGFDEIVRKIAGFFGERGIRQLFLGDAVKVTASQRRRLNVMWTEVLETLDWPERPELYVTQTPIANAMAVGFDKPFVIVHSGLLEVLTDEELRSVLGHELGHIMSGHTVYSTIAYILLYFGLSNLPFLAAAAILPFQLALLEWQRKSEFSSDRAGLLVSQDLNISMSTEMKLAGGREFGDELRVEEFIRQAEQYETGGDAWDTILKIMN